MLCLADVPRRPALVWKRWGGGLIQKLCHLKYSPCRRGVYLPCSQANIPECRVPGLTLKPGDHNLHFYRSSSDSYVCQYLELVEIGPGFLSQASITDLLLPAESQSSRVPVSTSVTLQEAARMLKLGTCSPDRVLAPPFTWCKSVGLRASITPSISVSLTVKEANRNLSQEIWRY